jgi:hypothetical protein
MKFYLVLILLTIYFPFVPISPQTNCGKFIGQVLLHYQNEQHIFISSLVKISFQIVLINVY